MGGGKSKERRWLALWQTERLSRWTLGARLEGHMVDKHEAMAWGRVMDLIEYTHEVQGVSYRSGCKVVVERVS